MEKTPCHSWDVPAPFAQLLGTAARGSLLGTWGALEEAQKPAGERQGLRDEHKETLNELELPFTGWCPVEKIGCDHVTEAVIRQTHKGAK